MFEDNGRGVPTVAQHQSSHKKNIQDVRVHSRLTDSRKIIFWAALRAMETELIDTNPSYNRVAIQLSKELPFSVTEGNVRGACESGVISWNRLRPKRVELETRVTDGSEITSPVINEIKEDINGLRTQLDQLTSRDDQIISGLHGRMNTAEGRITKIEAKDGKLPPGMINLESFRAEVKSLREDMIEVEKNQDGYSRAANTFDMRIHNLNKSIQVIDNQVQELNKTFKKLSDRVADFESGLDTLLAEVSKLPASKVDVTVLKNENLELPAIPSLTVPSKVLTEQTLASIPMPVVKSVTVDHVDAEVTPTQEEKQKQLLFNRLGATWRRAMNQPYTFVDDIPLRKITEKAGSFFVASFVLKPSPGGARTYLWVVTIRHNKLAKMRLAHNSSIVEKVEKEMVGEVSKIFKDIGCRGCHDFIRMNGSMVLGARHMTQEEVNLVPGSNGYTVTHVSSMPDSPLSEAIKVGLMK